MLEKIKITCTSFLPPNNSAWIELNKVKFSDFGDWYNFLRNSVYNEPIVFVLFIEDLIYLNNLNQKLDFQKLSNIISSLENRLKFAKKPTIFFSSFWINENLCRSIKQETHVEKLKKKFYSYLSKLSKKFPLFFFVDIDKEFSKFGFSNTFDKRNWYFARCRLSNTGLKVLSDTIKTVLKNHFTPAKKVLVLDCDNTLWGGVVGEDGVKGLKLGQDGDGKAYQDFQRAIKFHQKNGIILALNSKNNDRDVWKVFLNHREMILKKKDIISSKINWNEKFDNLIAISKELDLNLDSFVFWDDNPIEREKVKKNLPQVDVIDVADEVNQWADQLYTLDQFAKLVVTKEDLRKTNQYKSRAKFLKAINISKNEIDYLKSIKLKPKILKIDKYNLSRAEQLCMKTNQFNLRTTRYKANEIQHLSKNMQNIVFLTNLEDIYGNHGIISLVIVKKIDNEIAFLDSFLMSCRILGRHLESWIINETIKKCKQRGYKILISEYIPTQKNLMVKNFTSKNGFTNNINNKKILNLFKKNKKNITFAELKKVKIPYLDVYK